MKKKKKKTIKTKYIYKSELRKKHYKMSKDVFPRMKRSIQLFWFCSSIHIVNPALRFSFPVFSFILIFCKDCFPTLLLTAIPIHILNNILNILFNLFFGNTWDISFFLLFIDNTIYHRQTNFIHRQIMLIVKVLLFVVRLVNVFHLKD